MKRILIGLAVAAATTAARAQAPEAVPAGADAPFGASASIVATTDLARVTGRADTAMVIRAQNTSTVSNNTVSGNSQTGGISFDQSAFQGLAGLSLLSANTGNNVSINSSLNLNVSIQP